MQTCAASTANQRCTFVPLCNIDYIGQPSGSSSDDRPIALPQTLDGTLQRCKCRTAASRSACPSWGSTSFWTASTAWGMPCKAIKPGIYMKAPGPASKRSSFQEQDQHKPQQTKELAVLAAATLSVTPGAAAGLACTAMWRGVVRTGGRSIGFSSEGTQGPFGTPAVGCTSRNRPKNWRF